MQLQDESFESAEGWFEIRPVVSSRWFSVGQPTQLVRNGRVESHDPLSEDERSLRARSGDGICLPAPPTISTNQPSPASWDTSIAQPGEPTLQDIGLDGPIWPDPEN